MVREQEKPSFSNLFQMGVVLVWILALWIISVRMGGVPLVAKFLSPSYWWLVDVGMAILALFLVSLVYSDPPQNPRRGLGLVLQVGVMLVPLLYLPVAVQSGLSPDAAKNRAVNLMHLREMPHSQPDAGADPAGVHDPESAATQGPPEAVSLVDLHHRAEKYQGKRVSAEGSVFLDDKLPPGSFFFYRLRMWCCAADARPIGVLVRYQGSPELKSGDWVTVEGTAGIEEVRGVRVVVVRAYGVRITAAPKVLYLFD